MRLWRRQSDSDWHRSFRCRFIRPPRLGNIHADTENARISTVNNVLRLRPRKRIRKKNPSLFPGVFRDLVSGVAVWRKPGDHPLQQSGPRLQEAASVHLPRRQRDRVCQVKDTDGLQPTTRFNDPNQGHGVSAGFEIKCWVNAPFDSDR